MPDNKKFLDYDGLIFLWGKIKEALNTKLNKTDIAAWAKAADKPDYDSSEISHEFDSDVSLTPDVETVEEALNYLYTFSEDVHSKVTSSTGISASSTDGQYPSAKATYNAVNAKADKATMLAGYGITDAYTKTETDSAIASAVGEITGIDFQIVQALPASGVKGTIYLVSNSGSGQNIYDEYIWLAPEGSTAHWEKIGTTDVDLTNYWNTTNLSAMSNTDIQNAINAAETPAS